MRKIITIITVLTFLVSMSGCALIFTGGKAKMTAQSDPEGAEVIINGQSYGKTPVKFKLKTKEDYNIVFKKDGYKPVTIKVNSKVGAGWIVLDVLMGLVPVIVDAATGAWNKLDQRNLNAVLEKQQPRP